jgi:hypothetical protein
MIKKLVQATLLAATIILAVANTAKAQNNAAAFAAADTSKFSVNAAGGWQLYNAFLDRYKTDSVQLELIIQHNNISLQQEQYVGNIEYAPFKPAVTQTVAFSLLSNNYTLRIETSGKCYLKWLSATAQATGLVVMPVKVFYKQ